MDVVLLTSGLIALVVGAVFAHLERWSIGPPLLGLLGGVVIGPHVLDAVAIPEPDAIHVMQVAARLLLAVALMGTALRYPTADMWARRRPVALLVLVVMPAMTATVALGAAWTLSLPLAMAAVLGASLSPTDPVLASGIVTGQPAEEDIDETDRQVLALESGANDGLALPLVVIALAWLLEHPPGSEAASAVYQIVGAVVVGAVAGGLAGRALNWAHDHREIGPAVQSLYALVLAGFVLGLCRTLAVDDLLGVFAAGLVHNRVVTSGERESEVAVDEALNQYLVIPVFVLLGVVLPWAGWRTLGWPGVAFVAVVLLLRRLPAVVALKRPLQATWTQVLWLGWFGPVGVAAIYYLGHAHEEGATDSRLWAAGTLAVAASTLVHGLTAGPGRVLYRRSVGTWTGRRTG
ncbi:MAG: cation:proton antiporter [Actinobacteria bacterium]|jgi:NhaP-type Na+/H+ or K+/H+ antiporter|nr:cation:proton antiporter [Actinomycetota bacterium]